MSDDWERLVKRPEEVCASCGRKMATGEEVVATLVMDDEGFRREDRCAACFEGMEEQPFSFWRLRRTAAFAKGERRLDLAFLTELFKRLDGRDDEHSRRVAWLVALLLMRKRILELEGRGMKDGREVLHVRLKREDRRFEVADPGLTPEAVASLHEDLSSIFNLESGDERETEGEDQGS